MSQKTFGGFQVTNIGLQKIKQTPKSQEEELLTEAGIRVVMVVSTFPASSFFVRRCKNVKHSTRGDRSETMQIPATLRIQN